MLTERERKLLWRFRRINLTHTNDNLKNTDRMMTMKNKGDGVDKVKL